MKLKCVFSFILCIVAFFIPWHTAAQAPATDRFRQEGIASWYGKEFDGRPTASGEIYDSSLLTAAHLTLPFGTMLVVTNRHNNKKVTVKVNDRGPFVSARIIDVSRAAAEQLDMIITGTVPVIIESVNQIVVSPPAMDPPRTPPPVAVTAPVNAPSNSYTAPADVYVPPPVTTPVYTRTRLTPEINIAPNKMYRLQVGSYRVARNAVETFDRLKNAGLNPAYERHTDPEKGELFRVVLAGIRGSEVQSVAEKIGMAGFREALVREE